MLSVKEQLDIAKAYASQVESPIEIDKQKEIVYLVDHITKEWIPAEEILVKYFVKVGD